MKKITYKRTVEILSGGKSYYVRTREIADLFGIKQPFQFNTFLKKHSKVLTDKQTEKFRDKNIDSSRTTFIKLSDLLQVMKKHEKDIRKVAHNYESGKAAIDKCLSGKDFEWYL